MFKQSIFPQITAGEAGILQRRAKENLWGSLKRSFYRSDALLVLELSVSKQDEKRLNPRTWSTFSAERQQF